MFKNIYCTMRSCKTTLRYISLALVVFSLSACLASKPYEKPEIEMEDLYRFKNVQLDSATLADMPWQEVFEDEHLRDLIGEALAHNLNLQDAIQQIRVAEANFYQGKMSLLPSLSAAGNASYNEQSDNSVTFGGGQTGTVVPASERYTVSLQSSWELDVWGKLSSAKRAAFAALMQTEALRRAVQTRLIADVAIAYYRLLALDRQLAITKETVENRKSDVETVKSLKEGALVTGVAVQQSIANRYAAEVTIPQLQQLITEQENALSFLLGRPPGDVYRTSLGEQQPIDSLATGMPAQLLRNRPDIIAAEYAFRRAFEQTNNARAYFYPAFRLTAEGGFQSLETQDLFEPGSVFYNLVAGLTQPIFSNGQNKARLKRSKAEQQQALLQLKSSVLNASGEVSNALSQYKSADRRLELRAKQMEALEKAVEYARELLQYGESNYTEVLTAQQNLLSAQLSNVNDKLDQLIAGISLYRALGGGWDKEKAEFKQLAVPEAEAVEGEEN